MHGWVAASWKQSFFSKLRLCPIPNGQRQGQLHTFEPLQCRNESTLHFTPALLVQQCSNWTQQCAICTLEYCTTAIAAEAGIVQVVYRRDLSCRVVWGQLCFPVSLAPAPLACCWNNRSHALFMYYVLRQIIRYGYESSFGADKMKKKKRWKKSRIGCSSQGQG